ncbi:hypothetical protein D910_09465 [Dendroctonus ponderosae]|uniref:Uncharacterized protein n=1 Tax=Dendroctonus ponderosae TaxID=77166 RepID=U4UQ42_DENPD|nr:hypothetical protein D910_09465 [Dendroctonus ponderosae]
MFSWIGRKATKVKLKYCINANCYI